MSEWDDLKVEYGKKPKVEDKATALADPWASLKEEFTTVGKKEGEGKSVEVAVKQSKDKYEGMPGAGLLKFTEGMYKGMITDPARAIKQRGLEIGAKLGMVKPETRDEYQQYLDKVIREEAADVTPHKESRPMYHMGQWKDQESTVGTPGYAGHVIGEGLLFSKLPVGKGGLITKTAVGTGAGGLIGALQPTTSTENPLTNVVLGAGTGGIATAAAHEVPKLLKPLVSGGKAAVPETENLLRIANKHGYKLSPSEISPGRTLGMIEAALTYEPVAGDVIYKEGMKKIAFFDQKMNDLIAKGAPDQQIEVVGNDLKREAKNLLKKYSDKTDAKINEIIEGATGWVGSKSRVEAGESFGTILKNDLKSRRINEDILYDEVGDLLPKKGNTRVPVPDEVSTRLRAVEKWESAGTEKDADVLSYLRNYIPKPLGELPPEIAQIKSLGPGFLDKNPELKATLEAAEKKLKDVAAPKRTWQGMKKDMSVLYDKIQKARKDGSMTRAKMLGQIRDEIDKSMESYAESRGGDLWDKYKEAKAVAKERFDIYDRDVHKIMQKNPEQILDAIVKNKDQGYSILKQIKEGVPEAIKPLRQGFMGKIIENAKDSSGNIDLLKLKKGIANIGDDTWNLLATPSQRSLLNNMIQKGIDFRNVREGGRVFKFLETISGENGSKVIDAIVKPDNVKNIRIAKSLLPKERIEELTSEVLEKKVFSITPEGHYRPVASVKGFNKYETVLKELLTPDKYNEIKEIMALGNVADRVEKLAVNASQTGQTLVMHGVVKDATRAITQGVAGIGKAVLHYGVEWNMGKMLAKLYTSDAARSYFIKALRASPTSPEAIGNFGKALAIIASESQGQNNRKEELGSKLPSGMTDDEFNKMDAAYKAATTSSPPPKRKFYGSD